MRLPRSARSTFALMAILVSALLTGCATSGDMKGLQEQITDLHDQIAELKKQASSKEEVQRLNQNLATQTQTLLRSNADLTVKVTGIDERMQNTQGTIEQTNYRIDRLAQQVTENQRQIAELQASLRVLTPSSPGAAGTPIEEEVTVAPPGDVTEDPIAIYQAAYRDYTRGNWELAIEGFSEFLRNNPTSDLADNAAYWIGESLFSQRKFPEAIQQFDNVIKSYPQSDKVPAALLKKGYAYIDLGEKAQGIVQLQYVVHEHPRSNEASLARQRLKTLGIDTN
jgi:tol-pal system protein YbgF